MRRTLTILAILAALATAACADPATAQRALEQAGYKNITLTGHTWFGCGKDDNYSTGFVATSVSGAKVTGVVCNGWLKGATIRTF
jgi:hypothetical protein